MQFDGYTPQAIPRFGSRVDSDDETELPIGIAKDVQNCEYRAQSVGPRDGTGLKLNFGVGKTSGQGVRGFALLRYLAADTSGQENIAVIACTADGKVYSAAPFVQNSIVDLTTTLLNNGGVLASGLYPQLAQAYNKMLITQGNLLTGQAPALIVDGATLTCDQVSDKPFGDTWQPLTKYRVGHVVSPTTNTTATELYVCTQTGRSGNLEPLWPPLEGEIVTDGVGVGNIVWKKINILCTSGLESPDVPILAATPAGTLVAPGATLFVVCTWTNQFGESVANVVNADGSMGAVLKYKNTTGAAQNVSIALPTVPVDIALLAAQYAITSCNVYGYLVAGVPDPTFYLDPTSYAYMTSGAVGAVVALNAVPTGRQIPQANNAFTSPVGNVAIGVRYMIVLYMTRTGFITGFSSPAPIRCDISVDSRQLLVQNIPIGPYNTAARILAFTVAGQGSGGPYFYIPSDDYVDPGLGAAKIKQTATKITDNVTTSAYFDFLDSYLEGASNVTDYFDRIEVPFCSDVYFSKHLNRVIYVGCVGYPSAALVSDIEDPEAIRVPGSNLNVSLDDGDRLVCWREMGTVQVAYKENSAHTITPNDGDPSTWDAEPEWTGSGPCGPRAIDVATADGERLHAYAHRTGGYVWTGSGAPTLVTQDLTGTQDRLGLWDRINWHYSYLISTNINLRKREIYFHVPLDGAMQNNCRITLNFFYGLDDPIVFIQRTGKEVPNITGRKWSLDSVVANCGFYSPQRTSAEG